MNIMKRVEEMIDRKIEKQLNEKEYENEIYKKIKNYK
jgi:hypothetical protein